MKSLKIVLGLALVSLLIVSCKNEAQTPETKIVQTEEVTATNSIDPDAKIAKAEFNIEGMTCAVGCAKTIEKKLATLEGVKSATVDFDKKLATVEFDENKLNTAALEETVSKAGEQYKVSGMKTVESITSNGAKKDCKEDCKKACCAGKDKKSCDKAKASCKLGDKAQASATDKKSCSKTCASKKA
jgi:copper chaperone CopZ